MRQVFSNKWKSSTQPRKQRKYQYNAPLHVQSKMLGSHLSKELRGKYNRRSVRPIKGDKAKVMVGQHKGKSGRIDRIDTEKKKAYISGIEFIKKDGNKVMYPINVTNIMITELELSDKKRKAILERNKNEQKTS